MKRTKPCGKRPTKTDLSVSTLQAENAQLRREIEQLQSDIRKLSCLYSAVVKQARLPQWGQKLCQMHDGGMSLRDISEAENVTEDVARYHMRKKRGTYKRQKVVQRTSSQGSSSPPKSQ